MLWSCPASAQQAPSAADLATARELFLQARDLRTGGDLKGAIDKFRGAYATAPTPIIGLELGRTYMQKGDLIEAREAFLAVGRLKVEADETSKSAQARTEATELAEQLRPKIATLVVKVTGATSDGATVALTVDGANVPLISGSATRKVNPGKHELVVKTGTSEKRDSVELAEGESKEVTEDLGTATSVGAVTPVPTTPPTASAGDAASTPDWVRPAMIYGGFGLAGAGVIMGSVTGVVALGKARTVKNECPGQVCPESARKDVTSGRTFSTLSTVGFIAGAVGAGAGLVGLFVLKPAPAKSDAPKSDAPKSDAPKASATILPTATFVPGGAWLGAEGRF